MIKFLVNALQNYTFYTGCIEINFWNKVNKYAGKFRSRKKAKQRTYKEIIKRILNLCTQAHIFANDVIEIYRDKELEDMNPIIKEFFTGASIYTKGFACELADIIAYINFTSNDRLLQPLSNFHYMRL